MVLIPLPIHNDTTYSHQPNHSQVTIISNQQFRTYTGGHWSCFPHCLLLSLSRVISLRIRVLLISRNIFPSHEPSTCHLLQKEPAKVYTFWLFLKAQKSLECIVGYYKGNRCRSEGQHTSKGAFIVDPAKRTELVVPDLTGFKVLL